MSSRMCGAHIYRWLAATFGFMDTIADEGLWMPGSVTHIWLELSAVAPEVNVLLAKPMLWEGGGSANLWRTINSFGPEASSTRLCWVGWIQ